MLWVFTECYWVFTERLDRWMKSLDQVDDRGPCLPATVKKFREEWEPKEGKAYDWVVVRADAEFARLEKVFKETDDKAESIIRWLGGGTGLFTAALIFGAKDHAGLIFFAVPSIAVAILSVWYAVRCRLPKTTAGHPGPAEMVDYENEFDRAEWHFLGQLNEMIAVMRLVITLKSGYLARATLCYWLAIALLLLPLLAAMILR